MTEKSRTWTLTPRNANPGWVQAVMADLPALRYQVQPRVGAHGEVSGAGVRPPQWMLDLAQEYRDRGIRYDID